MHDVENLTRAAQLPGHGYRDGVLAELCSQLFTSLPRRDQQSKACEYIGGLLAADGRKSIRNIAAQAGGRSAEQGLHHFISDSNWDWVPVRTGLARHLARSAPPLAWVVRPMLIPKAGSHSVGVTKDFRPHFGQTLNAQQAVGVWAANEKAGVPVSWRLHLSGEWLDDARRRTRASIPADMRPETWDDCAIEAGLDMIGQPNLPACPIVLDAREGDSAGQVRELIASGVRFLVRVGGDLPLQLTDSRRPGGSALRADQIAWAVKGLRRPFTCPVSHPEPVARPGLVATVQVNLPRSAGRRGDLLLCCVSERGQDWPAEMWLTNIPAVEQVTLLRLRRLIHRVDRDFAEIADHVGIRDYAGRSFGGWHRHITLASVAHAAVVLRDAVRGHRRHRVS